MAWNPERYDQFKKVRYQPFYDLAAFIQPKENLRAIDLGCGTGEQTAILSRQFPGSHFTGIDASAEMLEKSKAFVNENLYFKQATTESVIHSDQKWDLIFSNAALQWSSDHEVLFPKLISCVQSDGQLAIQMPVQTENILNRILFDMVQEKPFSDYLKGYKRDSPVLSLDRYAQILFDNGIRDMQLLQKVYPIIAEDHKTLFEFISGTALLPYTERMDDDQQLHFKRVFLERIAAHFPKLPALYAFKRILLYGVKMV